MVGENIKDLPLSLAEWPYGWRVRRSEYRHPMAVEIIRGNFLNFSVNPLIFLDFSVCPVMFIHDISLYQQPRYL